MTVLSHSPADDRISPGEQERHLLIEQAESLKALLEQSLDEFKQYDPSDTSSKTHLEFGRTKNRLKAFVTSKQPDEFDKKLKELREYEDFVEEISTWKQFELADTPAPYEALIEGYLRVCLFLVVAYRASGKTNALMALSILIAGIVKQEDFPVRIPRKVVVFSEDPEQIHHILLGLAQLHGVPIEDIRERIFVFRAKRNLLNDLKPLQEFIAPYSEFVGDQEIKPLVCFDTYAANFDIRDENDNTQAAKVINSIEIGLPDYPVALICHTAKVDRNAKLDDVTARGAGALESGAKAVFVMGEDCGSRFMINTKRRDRAEIDEVEIKLSWHAVWVKDRFGFDQLIHLPMPLLHATSKEERQQRKEAEIEARDEPRIEEAKPLALQFIRDRAGRAEKKGQEEFRRYYRNELNKKAKDEILNEAHTRAMLEWRDA